MKKLLLLVILGGIGWFAYRTLMGSPERRSCQKLAELCGDKAQIDGCVSDVKDLGKMSKDAASKFDSCVADAKSCAAGAGCMVGAGLSAAGGLLNDFMKGVGDAVKK